MEAPVAITQRIAPERPQGRRPLGSSESHLMLRKEALQGQSHSLQSFTLTLRHHLDNLLGDKHNARDTKN